ncbi:hypothetical protein ACO1O0_008977 [Amphichorda felina]
MGNGTTMGRIRAYWLGSVVCMGGFLFGYDSGIVGGVLTMASFERDYGYSKANGTRTNALSVGLQQLGAFVGCFLAWPITAKLGRKKPLMIFSFVFCIGAAIQTINTGSLPAFYVARVIAGLGLGSSTVVTPMFNSEMTPKELRGQIGSFFQLFFTIGIFTSYWVDYGVVHIPNEPTMQWQIPIGLQMAPAAMLFLGTLTLKESTRWLTKQGRHEEAWESLKWIRADDSQAVADEMEEIRLGVEAEVQETEGFRLKELLEKDNFKRVFAAFSMMMAQQATGATAFAYFGPQYFSLLVGPGDQNLLLTAIFGAVKVAACGTFVVFLADRLPRRQVMIGGAACMAVCQITTAAVVKHNPPPTEPDSGVTSSARIREPGIATGVASQWLFNFIFSLTTPYMMESMGWGTFLLWGIFDAVISIVTFFFLKETKGMSLEAIAHQRFKKGGSSDLPLNANKTNQEETGLR